jgi:Tol biopolymer transport system component
MALDDSEFNNSKARKISAFVEEENSFAWSPDGSRLAYIEMDRKMGEARLMMEEVGKGSQTTITSWPIFKSAGTLPASANLSWSPDGKSLVFEITNESSVDSIYLVHIDGTKPIKLVNSAYAPTISADGRCLAYISNDQVFVMDLNSASFTSMPLSDLPVGNPAADIKLNKLQWKP